MEGSKGGKERGDKGTKTERNKERKDGKRSGEGKEEKKKTRLVPSEIVSTHSKSVRVQKRTKEQKGTHLRRLENLCKLHVRLDFYGDF